MLICMKLRLIASQLSMTRNSPILRSISAGSSVANIAMGFGNGTAGGTPGTTGGMTPAIGTPKGFHIFCMNSSACCGVNGIDAGFDMAWPPGAAANRGCTPLFG